MAKPADWDKPFPEKYLAAADAMTRLGHWLMCIGMSDNSHFKALQAEFIRHGGETFNDMQRTTEANKAD